MKDYFMKGLGLAMGVIGFSTPFIGGLVLLALVGSMF